MQQENRKQKTRRNYQQIKRVKKNLRNSASQYLRNLKKATTTIDLDTSFVQMLHNFAMSKNQNK